ncbi:toxin VasX [Pseudomonas typographi]|uniref:toxin VasX n=1 Tax=Pseudomonas typographi TaxID=2715964 RepID=UPI0016839C98|nr:toxin VasX [Pseudomonas typographi]MBD1553190.1 hypothetical protein [Pseudomonas typographi]
MSPRPLLRHPANLAALAGSNRDVRSLSSVCPLMQGKVQLLPLRYGLVERHDPAQAVPMPFTLKSRPLGIRMVRDGFLYLIDHSTGHLHEYVLEEGSVARQVSQGPAVHEDIRDIAVGEAELIFSRTATLYVAYSELQWTARKCQQVLASPADREHFMQAVDLAQVDAEQGGLHVLPRQQAQVWLAEVAAYCTFAPGNTVQGRTPAAPPAEQPDYHWEDPPLFRETHIGELLGQVLPAYEFDTLFLLLRDDIGVMRDLANLQDQVVGRIEQWLEGGADPGANERDYLSACYIESLTLLRDEDLPKLDDPGAQAMLQDLANLPEPERGATRQAVTGYFNSPPPPHFNASNQPPALDAELNRIRFGTTRTNAYGTVQALQRANERYYARQALAAAHPPMVEKHLDTLMRLRTTRDAKLRDALHGAKLGQRGINDLIDRPAMDAFLATHRPSLQRWNALLECITGDRTQMLTEQRFHRAAWYYDAERPEQLGQAFTTQYACLRDICRSDTANEAIYAWLQANPHYDRPLFYTLTLNTQSELSAQYATLGLSTQVVTAATQEWVTQLAAVERGKLPALDELPEAVHTVAKAAQATLDPALAHGIGDAMQGFHQALQRQQVPDLDMLFRRLPAVLAPRLLDAARYEGLSFAVASEAQMQALQGDLKSTLDTRTQLKALLKQRKLATQLAGHKSPRSRALLEEIRTLRQQLDTLEPRLARALSPVAELPLESLRIAGAAPGRAGITVILPQAQHQVVLRGLENLRGGYASVGTFAKIGDGAGLAVFVAQLVNVWMIGRAVMNMPSDKRELMPLFGSIFATGAAGFAAVQAITDNAFRGRAGQLAQALQVHALKATRVQMGKLHFGLGAVNYLLGAVASSFSTWTHYCEWLGAIREGKASAQRGATLALAGSSGVLATNIYGVAHTGRAGWEVLKNISIPAKRNTAWALAGTRLSSVFMRFNIAGALFTVLELAGTAWYNRHNTTAHDDWLLSTPWSRDPEKRQRYPLVVYQQHLLGVIHIPSVQVKHHLHGREGAKSIAARDIAIVLTLPGLSRAALAPPLAGRPAVRLGLAAYRIHQVRYEKGEPQVRWFPITEQVAQALELAGDAPLMLQFPCPAPLEPAIGGIAYEDLLLELNIERLDEHGEYRPERHTLRVRPYRESLYQPTWERVQGEAAPWSTVEPMMLAEASNATE